MDSLEREVYHSDQAPDNEPSGDAGRLKDGDLLGIEWNCVNRKCYLVSNEIKRQLCMVNSKRLERK
jgi:hypothetical protein